MWRSLLVLGLLVAWCASAPAWQRDFETPLATFHGTLRSVDKKEIVVALPDDQEVTFHYTRKTRFLKGSKPIRPGDIPAGTEVSVEARRDAFGDVEAVTVKVTPLEK